MPEILSQRDLNRATLARQHLLARAAMPASAMIEHLVGMQAQLPRDPYIGIWSRIEGFEAAALSDLLRDRQATRAPLMRSTIHLTSATDTPRFFALMGAMLQQRVMTGSPFGRRLDGLELDIIRESARELIEAAPRTTAELGSLLAERFPGHDGEAMAQVATRIVPMVQVTPRGLWRQSGQTRWATADQWLDAPLATAPSRQDLVRRYLAAFGPASVMDMQNWSGLTKLKADFDALRPELLTFRDASGKELFDLVDAPRPPAVIPTPVRFLPVYDNVVLGHADRSRFFAADTPVPENAGLGRDVGTILVEGFVRGIWKQDGTRRNAILHISLFPGCPRDAEAEVAIEGQRLLAFLADDAVSHEVRFAPL